MIENNEKAKTLRQKLNEIECLGSRELIRHLNEEYGAGFPEEMRIERLSDLSNEDGDIDGYLDPCDLVMDLPDLKEFLRWRCRLLLTEKLRAAIEVLETEDGSVAGSVDAGLTEAVRTAREIIAVSEEFIASAEELICAVSGNKKDESE